LKKATIRRKEPRGSWFVPGCFIVLMVLVIIEIMRPLEKAQPEPTPQFTEVQIHEFWDRYLNRVVLEEVGNGRHPVEAVNVRYRALWDRVRARYGPGVLHVTAVTSYNEHSPNVPMGTNYDQGFPTLVVYVPAIMGQWMAVILGNDPATIRMFEGNVAIGMLHEIEHMTRGRGSDLTGDELIEDETATWAETCGTTMPIFLDSGYVLDPSNRSYYDEWRKCGGETNPCWRRFIASTYAELASHNRK
jgi:hypothetical protein